MTRLSWLRRPTPQELADDVIAPTLEALQMDSSAARRLMLMTALHESGGLEHVRQVGGGPAISWWQIEPATAHDILYRYLGDRAGIAGRLLALLGCDDSHAGADYWHFVPRRLIDRLLGTDPAFACAVARIRSWMVPEPLPDANDLDGLAWYWGRHYQTDGDGDKVARFLDDYDRYMKE